VVKNFICHFLASKDSSLALSLPRQEQLKRGEKIEVIFNTTSKLGGSEDQ
jgi:hypothetical protein